MDRNESEHARRIAAHPNFVPSYLPEGFFSGAFTQSKCDEWLVRLANQYPVLSNSFVREGYTPLMLAIRLKNYGLVEGLLCRDVERHSAHRLDPNRLCQGEGENAGETALTFAVQEGDSNAIGLLLRRPSVDPNRLNRNGYSPLAIAVEKGDRQSLRDLLDYSDKIDPNVPNGDGKTPLVISIEKGDMESFQTLLASEKVDVNGKVRGIEPLAVAYRTGNMEATRVLYRRPNIDLRCLSRAERLALRMKSLGWSNVA